MGASEAHCDRSIWAIEAIITSQTIRDQMEILAGIGPLTKEEIPSIIPPTCPKCYALGLF